MPVNKNAMTRYKVLDDLLSNRYHNYTIDDIVVTVNLKLEELGIEAVSRRCIEKDIAYLKGEQSLFGADIESYSVDVYNGEKTIKKRCLRYEQPSFSIFKKEMSDDEAYLLSQTLSLLGQFDGLPQLGELNRLRSGLNKCDERKIVSFTKNPLENTNLFGSLYTSIAQKQVIRLTYHTLANLTSRPSILLHPYLLKEYNRRWFLFGAADSDNKMLSFSLDQIEEIEPMPAQTYRPYDGELEEYFDDIIGVSLYENRPVDQILFWVSDRSKNYVATKPIHDSQILFKNESDHKLREQYSHLQGGYFFSIRCIENYELIRELSSFGSDLIVLSPKHIQDKVYQRIDEMITEYNKLRT